MRPLVPLLAVSLAPALHAQCEQVELLASDGAASDSLGRAVAIDGDTALVGSWLDHQAGIWSGSAYVFVRTGGQWTEQAKLVPSDAAEGQRFGISVALSGDTALVGALHDEQLGTAAGAAYVFVRNGAAWTQEAKLTASDGAPYHEFGGAVAVSGDRAVVGAATWDSFVDGSGWAYVLERSGAVWSEVAVLEPIDAADGDRFGASVAVAGDTVAVGAPWADFSYGVTYLFQPAGPDWVQVRKLKPHELDVNDEFGAAVSLHGAALAVGAPGNDDLGHDAGAVYLFEDDGLDWKKRAKLLARDGEAEDRFGDALALGSGRVVVGAWGEDGDSGCGFDCRPGKAYLFAGAGTSWEQTAALVSSDVAQYDRFGHAVALSGDLALVGAPYHDHGAPSAGAAYAFDLDPPLGTNYCVANANSTGQRARISATGQPGVAAGCLHLLGSKLPPDRFGYFVMSESSDFVPYFAGSQGNLCLGAPIYRFADHVQSSGPTGGIALSPDLTDLPQGVGFDPGETWYFQLWFRDDHPGPTSNTTDGLSITWQ